MNRETSEFLLEHIKLLAKEVEVPYNGFGTYEIKVSVQDNRITSISVCGRATIKPK
jgi:hypothetical protein